MQNNSVTLAHDTRYTTHDTRHQSYAQSETHRSHSTPSGTHDNSIADSRDDTTGRIARRQALTTPAYAQNQDTIHVAIAIYDPSGNYSSYAGALMVSIFEHTNSSVVLHVFHDDTLSQDNRAKFIRTAEKYSQTVEFIDITKHKALIDAKLSEMCGKYTIGTLFRMFMPDELSKLDKVIYFDIDLMISLDIKELWDVDFEGKSIAGVHDESFVYVKPFPFSERGTLIKFT
ncbi:MAG: hypothetical protein IJS28_02360, partial [Synergistaceae bacterium]|nr:hypothetical protein [Synergistaceae bacterium]